MRLTTFTAITLLVLLYFVGMGFSLPYTKNSGVIALTKDNFANEVFSSPHVWIVEFYAPCGHCKNLAPEWEKLAKTMKGIIKVAAVNCDEHKELAGAFGVQGFPTIKLFPSELTPVPNGKGYHKQPIDYNGPRTAAAIANFAVSHLPNFVKKVDEKNSEEFISAAGPKVLLFSEKTETTNLFKALAIDFKDQISFGQVKSTYKELVDTFGVAKFPTLLVIKEDGSHVTYDGQLNHDSLFAFLKPFGKAPSGSKQQQQQQKSEPTPTPEVIRPVREEVKDQATFDSVCTKTKSCIVAFLDPTNTDAAEHESYIEMLEKLQQKYEKTYNIVWVDGITQYEWIQNWNLASGFPNFMVYNHKKGVAVPYIGPINDKSIAEFLDSVLRGTSRRAFKVPAAPVITGPKDEKKPEKTEL